MNQALKQEKLVYRHPTTEDAGAVWHLVKNSGRLDLNSSYLYLLLFRYFADTCLIAERGGKLLGFVTSFVPPANHSSLFVWQIAVAPAARGQGIATKLLQRLPELPAGRTVSLMEATVSPSNHSSRRLFEAVARARDTTCEVVEGGFSASQFPEAGHEDELLVRVALKAGNNRNHSKGD